MSNKPSELEIAERELAELQGQKGKLQATIARLETALTTADFSNVDVAVSMIASNQASLMATEQTLELLRSKILSTEQKAEACRRLEREAQGAALRPSEEAAYQVCVGLLVELGQALDELLRIHRLLMGEYKLGSHRVLPGSINSVVRKTLDFLRINDPVSLGLHPRPSPEELRKREAEYNVTRLSGLLDQAKRMNKEKRTTDCERLVEESELNLQRAKATLAAMQ